MAVKKRVILHIGAHKTGSTALQASFSMARSTLRDAGVDYPFHESPSLIRRGRCRGNLAQMMTQMKIATWPDFSEGIREVPARMAQAVADSPCDQVLFSGELCCRLSADMVQQLAAALQDYQVSVVMFVRDPFDFTLSMWAQRVKLQEFEGTIHDYFVERCVSGTHELFQGVRNFARCFEDVRLIPYDRVRADIFTAFVETAGLQLAPQLLSGAAELQGMNGSLNVAQAQQAIRLHQSHGKDIARAYVGYVLSQHSGSRSRFYDRQLHEQLLQAYAAELELINARLPAEAALATCVRGTADQGVDEVELEQATAQYQRFLQLLGSYPVRPSGSGERLCSLLMGWILPGVPKDFDAARYAALNPELSGGSLALYRHYSAAGRAEGRLYRIKDIDRLSLAQRAEWLSAR